METIFDHNMSKEEEKHALHTLTKEKYLSIIDSDSAFQDIAFLYYHRNNVKKMKKYANKIQSVNLRSQFWRTILHP